MTVGAMFGTANDLIRDSATCPDLEQLVQPAISKQHQQASGTTTYVTCATKLCTATQRSDTFGLIKTPFKLLATCSSVNFRILWLSPPCYNMSVLPGPMPSQQRDVQVSRVLLETRHNHVASCTM